MKKSLKLVTGGAVALTLMFACGEDKEEPAPTITYVSMTLENSPSADEDTKIEMTSQEKCHFDAESGLFEGTFNGSGGKKLVAKIKDFAKKDATYTCKQDPENTTGEVSSAKYTSCSISITNLMKAGSAFTNTYGLYREADDWDDFTYAGACTIAVKYDSAIKNVTGTMACTKLIQTFRKNGQRNPIDADTTVDVKSDSTFSCTVN